MVLKVNNLSLPLKWTPMGPLLSTEDKFLEPIAWIVNPPVASKNSHFADSLARGDDVFMQRLYAVRPKPDEVLPEDRALWRELTGSELGQDVYLLGTTFTRQLVLPRQTLQEIVQALLKKRAEFPEPPFPWLFQRDPYHLGPATGEKELLCELEKRATGFKNPFLCQQTDETALSVKRQELLRDLEAAGLFSDAYFKEKHMWLEMWGGLTLLEYYKAATEFFNHFRTQKQQVIPGAAPMPVLAMSIDGLPNRVEEQEMRVAYRNPKLFVPKAHDINGSSARAL
ncbi:MAG: hypothetical protein ACPGWR_21660 [Ardenticatenaceae bacterium]